MGGEERTRKKGGEERARGRHDRESGKVQRLRSENVSVKVERE